MTGQGVRGVSSGSGERVAALRRIECAGCVEALEHLLDEVPAVGRHLDDRELEVEKAAGQRRISRLQISKSHAGDLNVIVLEVKEILRQRQVPTEKRHDRFKTLLA